ncbi:MAG: hypothetical protein EXR75_06770 [Myxococcales bacterium]|nr:hypothetical protein [Myxococcales bacterium]
MILSGLSVSYLAIGAILDLTDKNLTDKIGQALSGVSILVVGVGSVAIGASLLGNSEPTKSKLLRSALYCYTVHFAGLALAVLVSGFEAVPERGNEIRDLWMVIGPGGIWSAYFFVWAAITISSRARSFNVRSGDSMSIANT